MKVKHSSKLLKCNLNLFLPAGEEAQIPPVHPSRPEGGQRASTPDGLVLRQTPSTTTALSAAADPQPATAALQLPHHSARPSKVSINHESVTSVCVCLCACVHGWTIYIYCITLYISLS